MLSVIVIVIVIVAVVYHIIIIVSVHDIYIKECINFSQFSRRRAEYQKGISQNNTFQLYQA